MIAYPDDYSAQVLRVLDKTDKIGVAGVVAALQMPKSEFGADLDPVRSALIGQFLECKGATNSETLSNIGEWFGRAPLVMARLRLMVALESCEIGEGRTAWDDLIDMRENACQTWRDNGRPANIGWALDDMTAALKDKFTTDGAQL